MSSVGNAEKKHSGQDESVRRAREAYIEKETDQAKIHATEMKRMADSYQEEIRGLKETHSTQMEDLKTKARDAISNRDMRYQKEIEELRQMHQNQVRRQASETENKLQKTREFASEQIQHTSAVKDQQKQVMAEQYEAQIAQEGKRFENYGNASREKLQTTVADQRDKLNSQHDKEMKIVTGEHERLKAIERTNFHNLRKQKDTQIKDLETSKREEAGRLSSKFESSLREEQETNQRNMDDSRLSMKEGIDKNRERYMKALDERAEEARNSNALFKETAGERINNRLNAGQAQNHHLKSELTRQRTEMTKDKNREVRNVRDAMQANIEGLEEQRQETVAASNEKNKAEITDVQKRNEQLVNRTNRFYQEKMVTDRMIADERNTNTKMGLEKRLARTEISGDDRVQKLQASNVREEANLRNFFDKNTTAQKDNYEQTLIKLRETNKRDQDAIFQNFAKQADDREIKFQQKLVDINSKFETQIQIQKEDNSKKMTEQMAILNKEKKNILEQKNSEILRQASQYENRIAKLEETHRREVDGLKERHAESLTSMTRSKGRT